MSMNASLDPVLMVERVKIYKEATDASADQGISGNSARRVCSQLLFNYNGAEVRHSPVAVHLSILYNYGILWHILVL